MRKFALSLAVLLACVGLTLAATVTFKKYDETKKELTVEEDGKDKTYKITDKTKVKVGDKDGDLEKLTKGWVKNGEKMAGKSKLDITVEKDEITEIKTKARKNDK